MAGKYVPVVLIPRWTTYLGSAVYATMPMPVAAYDHLVLSFIAGPPTGGAIVTLHAKESNDLSNWTDCAGPVPGLPLPMVEAQWRFGLEKGWFQFLVKQTVVNGGFTCAAQGYLELRER